MFGWWNNSFGPHVSPDWLATFSDTYFSYPNRMSPRCVISIILGVMCLGAFAGEDLSPTSVEGPETDPFYIGRLYYDTSNCTGIRSVKLYRATCGTQVERCNPDGSKSIYRCTSPCTNCTLISTITSTQMTTCTNPETNQEYKNGWILNFCGTLSTLTKILPKRQYLIRVRNLPLLIGIALLNTAFTCRNLRSVRWIAP